MQKQSLILIGGGGHCRSCIDVIEQEGKFRIAGVLDNTIAPGTLLDGYPILGNDSLIEQLVQDRNVFLITIGQIKTAKIRKKIYSHLKHLNGCFATIISPLAYLAPKAKVGEGSIVMHGAIVNAGVVIGINAIINTKALVEHDAVIGAHCHISTGSVVNGTCNIGDEVFIGSGSVVANNITIINETTLGAGTIVVNNITEPGTYVGNPQRKIKLL